MDKKIVELAQQAKSVKELRKAAKKNGIELSEKEAQEYFDRANASEELSDDDLEAAAGGFFTSNIDSSGKGFLKQLF